MGYQLLPPSKDSWWIVLGVLPTATFDEAQSAYRQLAQKSHPDFGGTHNEMAKINLAYQEAKAQLDTTRPVFS
ncbi:J domain-containing protein [Nostoc sp.]|uniref:J domain-containing protein n=1 Tax=Nostoc sp. TaxID=1180 RepID=UPI003FA57720